MTNLKTQYMGIELKNPIIIGANPMTSKVDDLKKLEDAGAAAVVFRSLFEEQIQLEKAQLDDDLDEYSERHAEMTSLFPHIEHAGPEEHLHNLKKARETISIPLFASLNAIFKESWIEYATLIEETGVNGLELNFYAVPKDIDITGVSIEKLQLDILKEIKKTVKIPVSVKLSPFYSNPLNFITELDKEGADGLVLFNRFYQSEIDIIKESHLSNHDLSSEDENKLPMRFAGLLFSHVAASICCNSGIHQGKDVIKMILAGADCVQIVSTLYKNKITHISKILKDIEEWMNVKKYSNINDFKGLLSRKNVNDPFIYQRAQYIELLIKSEEIFKKYPQR
jgi:dihydroorotate dehydrogenase (fumarate)